MSKALGWLLQNKARIGWAANFLAGGLVAGMAQSVIPASRPVEVAAFALSYLGAALVGAGHVKSDEFYRDRANGGR